MNTLEVNVWCIAWLTFHQFVLIVIIANNNEWPRQAALPSNKNHEAICLQCVVQSVWMENNKMQQQIRFIWPSEMQSIHREMRRLAPGNALCQGDWSRDRSTGTVSLAGVHLCNWKCHRSFRVWGVQKFVSSTIFHLVIKLGELNDAPNYCGKCAPRQCCTWLVEAWMLVVPEAYPSGKTPLTYFSRKAVVGPIRSASGPMLVSGHFAQLFAFFKGGFCGPSGTVFDPL